MDFHNTTRQFYSSVTQLETNYYICIIIFPIGFILNLVSIYVFSDKTLNSKSNMGYMHAFLCFFNLFPLVNPILLTQVLPRLSVYLVQHSNFLCKFLTFWQQFSLACPSFQQTVISFMFYLSVRFPIKYLNFQTNNKYLIVIASMVSLLVLANMEQFFFRAELVYVNSTSNFSVNISYAYICYASPDLTFAAGISSVLLRSFLPFFIMLALNILILVHFKKNKLRLNKNYQLKGHKNFFLAIFWTNFTKNVRAFFLIFS
jgi:hypothetical protein